MLLNNKINYNKNKLNFFFENIKKIIIFFFEYISTRIFSTL